MFYSLYVCHEIGPAILFKNRTKTYRFVFEKSLQQKGSCTDFSQIENLYQKMKKRRGKKEYSAPTNFKSQLQLVCNILEINSTTPQREVKKVDRKLVILYHPDELTYPNKSQKSRACEI